jgi:hypothetical protein
MLCRHERDRLAVVADALEGEHRLVGELEAVALLARNVVVGQDGVDAGHRDRFGDVDLRDQRVRVRAANGVAPEHPGRVEVARVGELARHLRDAVGALDALAYAPELESAGGGRRRGGTQADLRGDPTPASPPLGGDWASTRHPRSTVSIRDARVCQRDVLPA